MAFYGQATLNGSSVAIGNTIRAYYGADLGGEIKVQSNGIYGYPELNRQRLVVKKGNGPITFKFVDLLGNEKEGNSPISYPAFSSGTTIEKNLSFITTVVTPVQPSGGGGGNVATPTTTKIGDINGDNKVDKYDFSLMMSDWGKTGSNNCDLNNDGKVDKYDFALLMSKWGL